MMRGRKGDCCCKKCSWFGHMAYQCRKKEIMEERKGRLNSKGNKFTPLLSKVCRRMEGGNAVHPFEGKAQPIKYWGCREVGHIL